MEKVIFGAGCFWGVEAAFRKIKGVLSTRVGYSGGTTKNPTYEEVCDNDKTGYAEVVEITFNPQEISYEQLLNVFWNIHDPTTLNRQGPDVGRQYRSVIFYLSEEQKKIALNSLKQLENNGKYKRKIVTAIEPAQEFYEAEDYHQQYYEKHGGRHSCFY